MNAEVIPCPACRHPVRVPESLFGQAVRCPSCKAYFTAPTRDPEGRLDAGQLLAQPPAFNAEPPARPAANLATARSLLAPGLCLLFIGIVGVALHGKAVYHWIGDPERMRIQLRENSNNVIQAALKAQPDSLDEKQQQQAQEILPRLSIGLLIGFSSISILPLLGAVSILARRFYPLAIVGSVAAILEFDVCCINILAGVYCLIKLLGPQARALFRRGSHTPPI